MIHYFHLSVPNIFTWLVEIGVLSWMGEISTLATSNLHGKEETYFKSC